MAPEDLSVSFILAFVLITVRVGAALRLLPFFGGAPIPMLPWIALSGLLAMVLTPFGLPEAPLPTAPLPLIAMAIKELFVGIVIGTLARIAFSVLEMTGRLTERTAFPLIAADTETGIPPLYTLVGCAFFFLIGGHHTLIEGLRATLVCHPVGTLPATVDPAPAIALVAAAMGAAVMASVPVFVAGLAADVAVGGLSRIFADATVHGAAPIRSVAVLIVAAAAIGTAAAYTLSMLGETLAALADCGALS